jgi:hypothetical protein
VRVLYLLGCVSTRIIYKAKPAVRQGRKATDLLTDSWAAIMIAELSVKRWFGFSFLYDKNP